MPETPRTWTLRSTSIDGSDFETLDGPRSSLGERVEVVEKAPVDAERERILDLVKSMRQAIEFARCCDLSGERGWADHDSILNALDESQALVREHDRLQGNGMAEPKLTGPQIRALRVIEAGDCYQERGKGVNLVRLDVLLRLMRGGYVSWDRPSSLPPDITGRASLTDRGRGVLADV